MLSRVGNKEILIDVCEFGMILRLTYKANKHLFITLGPDREILVRDSHFQSEVL